MTSSQTKTQDVVDLLVEQHRQIKVMLSEFASAPAGQRQDRFEDIVRLLAMHESAEELVVHPAARDTGERIQNVVQERLGEEKDAKQMLAELYDLGIDNPEFSGKFTAFTEAVIAHATREEDQEFPALRTGVPEEKLERMARMLRAAEAMAPTRPHPRVSESRSANLLAGPPLAVFDRMRDALRDMRERSG
jgi:hemerythrin superfamily protein